MEPTELNGNVRAAVEKYARSLARIAFNYTKNMPAAEDVVQDVFLAYLQKQPVFDGDEYEKAWLIRVTVNKCKNVLRSKWFSSRRELSEDLSYLPEKTDDLLEKVLALPEKYSLPLHLYYYEGYSIKEIADITGDKPATVGTRLARAKEKLKAELGENGYEEYI